MKVLVVAAFLAVLLLLCGAGFASLLLFPSLMLVTLPFLVAETVILADAFMVVVNQR